MQAQDYSSLGKKINYSDVCRKAKKFKSIEEALLSPGEIQYLELTVDKDGLNYQKFVDNHSKFTALRKLIIDNRWYRLKLPANPDLSVFKELEFLQVYCLPSLKFDKLNELSHLKYLDLDACELTSVPVSILGLKQLEFLNVSMNFISGLPDNIGEMTSLKEIDLTNNCFAEIPKQIAEVKGLLYLDMNNAETAPQSLDGKLSCKNTLVVYPSVLADCKKLKKVSLYKVNVDKATQKKMKAEFKGVKIKF
ncbi:MAG: leucine-rich repeat-containing protein 47-like [Bacteroidetes bacterium]|jgi:hypothetical protein|nr:leucine-rich repeat-containing protein 47-like [Bacteroidota bacterium]